MIFGLKGMWYTLPYEQFSFRHTVRKARFPARKRMINQAFNTYQKKLFNTCARMWFQPYIVVSPQFLIFQQNNSAQTSVLIFFTTDSCTTANFDVGENPEKNGRISNSTLQKKNNFWLCTSDEFRAGTD